MEKQGCPLVRPLGGPLYKRTPFILYIKVLRSLELFGGQCNALYNHQVYIIGPAERDTEDKTVREKEYCKTKRHQTLTMSRIFCSSLHSLCSHGKG